MYKVKDNEHGVITQSGIHSLLKKKKVSGRMHEGKKVMEFEVTNKYSSPTVREDLRNWKLQWCIGRKIFFNYSITPLLQYSISFTVFRK